MDDTTQRVFKLAQECIEELKKKVEYIQLLEQYIEELESGLEVPAVESVQLEQPMEMEESNDNMDDRRPSVVRSRQAKQRDQGSSGSIDSIRDEPDNSDGGDSSTASSVDNSDGK
jgi:hypothetical protein